MAQSAKVHPDVPASPPVYTEQSTQLELPGYPAQQPAYPGPHPFATQPGNPPQTVQSVHQTSTIIMQPTTQAIVVQTPPPRPSSWLGLSIFTFLFCGALIGSIAVIFSCMVDSAFDRGDHEGAKRNANIAKWLNIIAIVSGVGVTVYLIVHFTILVSSIITL